MSLSPGMLHAPGGGADGGALFRHEARRDSHVVAVLEAFRSDDGSVVVEATVASAGKTGKAGKPAFEGLSRPFAFPHQETARRFADETLQALEFLGCEIVS